MPFNYRNLLHLVLSVFLLGCATSERSITEERNKSWIGHSMNELNLKRGLPSYAEPMSNGCVVFSYIQNNKGSNKVCKETFITNVQLIVAQTRTFMCIGPPMINPIGK